MDYKEKYEMALAKCKAYIDDTQKRWSEEFCKATEEVFFEIFPELKESEDAKILGLANMKRWIEKQGEQKPVDKVEPKFHEGDWITDGYVGGQITSIEDNYPCYKIADFMGGINTSIPFSLQDNYHLWTIQDAKDGDVLAYVTDEEDLWIMIYWSLYEPYEGHVHYHALLVNDDFSDKGTCCICIDNLKPATKEQRDLLFHKMKEAGYEWIAEKKELRKIEKQVDGFDSELNALLKKYEYLSKEEVAECLSFYLGVVQGKQKPEWTEEDEAQLQHCCGAVAAADYYTLEDKEEMENWLKSLKQRIGGQQ